MILTGHQPNYLPYVGFFHKIALADVFVIVDNVQFVKRGPFGWIHRNKIRTENGWDWLTIPVLTKGKFTQTILETKINNNLPWRRKHWKAIEWNYSKAPYFEKYAYLFQTIYEKRWDSLCELNVEAINVILEILGVQKKVLRASELKIEGKATHLITDMCRKVGADTYISGIHGKDYLDENLLKDDGIKLIYQEFNHPKYEQCQKGDFIPNLSIIDMIFNCGEKCLDLLMGK